MTSSQMQKTIAQDQNTMASFSQNLYQTTQAAGPRCVKEILDESQAMLLAEDKMLIDVS